MPESKSHHTQLNKLTFAGILITIGIVFGDIGTSPLYVIKAITGGAERFDELLVLATIVTGKQIGRAHI